MVVVTEFGVPIHVQRQFNYLDEPHQVHVPYGASPGVSSPDGGGGRLIKVGALVAIVSVWSELDLGMFFRVVDGSGEVVECFGKFGYKEPGPRDE